MIKNVLSIDSADGWHTGRQRGGYGYLNILALRMFRRFIFDIILLRYKEGQYIPPHKDPEVGMRINIMLKKPKKGGKFKVKKGFVLKLPRITIFRPYKQTHWVTKVTKGERLVLAIGIGNGRETALSKNQKRQQNEFILGVKESLYKSMRLLELEEENEGLKKLLKRHKIKYRKQDNTIKSLRKSKKQFTKKNVHNKGKTVGS